MIALHHPDIFGGALAQSPQLPTIRRIAALLERHRMRGGDAPRCYVDVGRYDESDAVEATQALCNVLVSGGAVVSYQEFAGGGSFAGWRVTLPDALRFHCGTSSLASLASV